MKKHKIRMIVDKSLSQGFWKQIGLLAIFVILLLVVSYILIAISGCDWCNYCSNHDVKPWLLPIYLLIDSNALNNLYISNEPGGSVHGWMLAASSIIYIFGIFCFNGLLIGVITNYIEHRVQDYRDGLRHYLRKGHHIIMGYDDMVPSIIEDIFNKAPKGNVMILSSYDVKQIKERLKKSVARDKLDQIIVNYGQKTASEYYKDIHLEAAEDIYVIGYRQLPSHDAVNVECVDSICSYLSGIESKKKPERIICMFEDIDTYAALKTSEIFARYKNLNIEIIPYNFYSGWARQVFVRRKYREKTKEEYDYPSIYGAGIGPNDKKHVHMVVVGSNNFASTMAMEAAHLHHFPNFEHDKSQKTRITFIDLKADKEMPLFFTRNRHFCEVQSYLYSDMTAKNAKYEPEIHSELLSPDIEMHDFLDVKFEFIKGDVFAGNVQQLLNEWAQDEEQCLSIFLAMTDQRDNFVMGMNMPDAVYENEIPVFVRQERADNFVTNLRLTDSKEFTYKYLVGDEEKPKTRKGRYANLYPFGMDDMAYCFDDTSLERGQLINYLYVIKNTEDLNGMDRDKIIKDAETSWKKLSIAEKWSNMYCADSIKCKMDSLRVMRNQNLGESNVGDRLSEYELTELSMVEHNRWNVEKLLLGYRMWRKNEKGIDNKELFIHPNIMPYDQLTKDNKNKNLTISNIPWILKMTEEK